MDNHLNPELTQEAEETAPASESLNESLNAGQDDAPGIDYTKDFIWGSDQDEYVDES
ncbi:hypothetical protein GCM10023310_12660 [Paenibacillus vulneris]|uniref:DUF4025 domain-containing protein n=1 Tax=Paenibacillus vulneris TaxID=1133364 RepID=A0ABW3UIZ3_9BACL